MRRILCLILLVLASACARAPIEATTGADSGVEGKVLIGPTCPVERIDEPCPDRAFSTDLLFHRANGSLAATAHSSADGTFKVALAPGTYTIDGPSSQIPPTLKPQTVVVAAHAYTTITVSFDSGIR